MLPRKKNYRGKFIVGKLPSGKIIVSKYALVEYEYNISQTGETKAILSFELTIDESVNKMPILTNLRLTRVEANPDLWSLTLLPTLPNKTSINLQ